MRWCRTYNHKLSKYLEGNLKQFRATKYISGGVFAKNCYCILLLQFIVISLSFLKFMDFFTSILQIWLVLATCFPHYYIVLSSITFVSKYSILFVSIKIIYLYHNFLQMPVKINVIPLQVKEKPAKLRVNIVFHIVIITKPVQKYVLTFTKMAMTQCKT